MILSYSWKGFWKLLVASAKSSRAATPICRPSRMAQPPQRTRAGWMMAMADEVLGTEQVAGPDVEQAAVPDAAMDATPTHRAAPTLRERQQPLPVLRQPI